ncbi:MAG: hypothetical protein ACLTF5_02330 [Butyricicoccus sp.]
MLSVGDRLTNPEQGFSVELPVNRDTITATMKKENGVWKLDSIDSQISLSAAVPADDEVCRERYPTFETARQAADSIDDQAYIKERVSLELFWAAPCGCSRMKRIERRTCCGDKSAVNGREK